ncbi:hypothetical protein PF008_g26936 [Phytophthora fragariae]|uniref:Integrase catalytic domain-containing protein n=1 Tax=Phytophthora fragariae TaxID=53985 RepID=A0A6G0QFL4_9STRA|nr:hypothetical protein PF008_g26936 [Phytophthora fragariae]
MATAMMVGSVLPHYLWEEALKHAAYIHNRVLHTGENETPSSRMFGVPPNLSRLPVFGQAVAVRIPDEVRRKRFRFRGCATLGAFIGMSDEVRGFRVYTPGDGRRITESRDVRLLASMLLDMAANTSSVSQGMVPDTYNAVLAPEQPSVHSSTPALEPTNSRHVDATSSPERSAAAVSQGNVDLVATEPAVKRAASDATPNANPMPTNSAEMEREPQGAEELERTRHVLQNTHYSREAVESMNGTTSLTARRRSDRISASHRPHDDRPDRCNSGAAEYVGSQTQ